MNVVLQNAMTLEQQNEVSKKNWESMSYATLYESMSMYAKSKIPMNLYTMNQLCISMNLCQCISKEKLQMGL